MAWLSSNSFVAGNAMSHAYLNNLANDIRAWGGDVNGGGYNLSNLAALTAATSVTNPLLIGGTAVSSTLTLQSTSGAGSSDAIVFKTASQSERMRILTTGEVGIGTASPGGKLEVVGGRSFFAAASEAYGVGAKFISTGGAVYFGATNGTGTPDAQISASGGVALMTLLNGGNVGIGTTTPGGTLPGGMTAGSRILEVRSPNNSTDVGLFLRRSDGATGLDIWHDASSDLSYDTRFVNIYSGSAFAFFNGSTEQMRITSGGNVGIGTTSPAYKLEISTDSAGKPGVGGLWTVVSDERIKTDITPADLDRCYEIVKSVPLKHFGFAPGVYTDEQIRDKHNLGWIAQDVQKVFAKAVSVKPFTLYPEIPDGVEEYEEQDFTLEAVEKTETSIQVINGKPVRVSKVVASENKVLLFDTVDVVDEAGDVVTEEYEVTPAILAVEATDETDAIEAVPAVMGNRSVTYQMPRMITKTRPKVRHKVIEDCLDLNGGQMIAALYGAVQSLMEKVEMLTAKLEAAK